MSEVIGARLLIAELSERGIVVWAEGERLRYKAPDGALTAQLRSRMADEKQRLLELLAGSGRTTGQQGLVPISACPPEAATRLSFAQERLWFLEEMLPGNPTYNMPYAYRLHGALDVDALRSALSQLIARHEILRTELFAVDGIAGVRIAPSRLIDLPVADLTGTPEAEREAYALQLAMAEARRPFDLSVAPLMRALLLRLDSTEHLFVLCLHHVVNDDWSLDVLWRELSVCYEASCSGMPPQLPEMPIRYSDFAAWQHEQSSAGRFAGQLAYWRSQLADPLPRLGLHTDFPRPSRKTYKGDVRYFVVPDELSGALRRLAQDCNATLFMVLAAAFKVLLYRYTGQEDVVIGTAIAGRGEREITDLVGFFINNLVLRTSVAGDPRFVDLVERVREVSLAAYENQDAPFERVIDALRPERDTSRTPFFDVLLVLHRPPEPRRLRGLAIEERRLATGSAKFDLTLEITEDGNGGLSGVFEFDTNLYLPATIDRVVSHLLVLLEAVAAAPTQRVSTLALLPAAERAQLAAWNATTRAYPDAVRVHELVAARAAQAPTRLAVTAGGTPWSYGELEAAANRFARELQARGIGRGQRVGLCLERGAEMLAAVLGVWKTGAAYVPLDPGFPAERLRYMVEDAQLAGLVATTALAAPFGVPRVQQVLLDADAAAIAGQAATAVDAAGAASDPAYVIYTSGSTGRPKGVVVPHGAVVNFLTSMAETPGLTAADVLVAVTTLSFDIAVLELLLPLVQGARVVIAAREDTLDGGRLRDLLAQSGATVLQGTPVTWRLLLEAEWRGAPGFTALVGGEALPKDLAEALLAKGVTLWNMYGPTETTVWSTCGRVETTGAGIRIGRPIANTTIEVVDGQGQLCPIGVPGEIYIGGAGVTQGYWQQPALTAARFVPDPAGTAGARRYRTGDRGRWHADGTLEHLGRLDDQAKVRGFRIELGEIEAVLSEHAAVQQAAVYVWEVKPGDVRLVACCVPAAGSTLAPPSLRKHLRTRLPDYMVPQHFVPIDRIPLTPNGKVNRRALPRPTATGSEGVDAAPKTASEAQLSLATPDPAPHASEKAFVAPRDALELQLTKIWEKVLAVKPIGMTDNFFDLGGHSVLAVGLLGEIEKGTGKNLPLATLFQALTIEQLADVLRAEEWSKLWSPLVAIQSKGSQPPFFFIHAISGNILNYRHLARHLGPDQPLYGLQARGLDGKQTPDTRIEDMAAFYIREIRRIQPEGPYFLGGGSSGGTVAFEMAQQLRARDQRVSLLAMFDTYLPNSRRYPVSTALSGSRVYKADRHLGRLLLLRPKDQLSYIFKLVKANIIPIDSNLKDIIYRGETPTEASASRALEVVLKASRQALSNYVPKAYAGRITLFMSSEAPDRPFYDGRLAWNEIASDGLEVHVIPGDHENGFEEPHVKVLAEKLRVCIQRAHEAIARQALN